MAGLNLNAVAARLIFLLVFTFLGLKLPAMSLTIHKDQEPGVCANCKSIKVPIGTVLPKGFCGTTFDNATQVDDVRRFKSPHASRRSGGGATPVTASTQGGPADFRGTGPVSNVGGPSVGVITHAAGPAVTTGPTGGHAAPTGPTTHPSTANGAVNLVKVHAPPAASGIFQAPGGATFIL